MEVLKKRARSQTEMLAAKEKKIKQTKISRKEKRLNEIYEAACELLSERNSNDFKVKEVADKIGIGRGTLYEIIKTKNDIIYIALKQWLNKAVDYVQTKTSNNLNQDPWEVLQAAIRAHLEFVAQNPKFLYILYQESTPISKSQFKEIFQLMEQYNEIFCRIIEKGAKEGIFRASNPYLIANSLTITLNTWVIKKNYLKYKFEITAFEKIVGRMVLQGVLDLDGKNTAQNLERLKKL